jgi:hypothetical protein
MSLNDLKKVISHSWRIQSVKGEYAQLVAYIDSRDVQNILDEVLGQANWADDYKEVDGKVFAGIGILVNEITGWVWKWDCGTESNIEKEKGQASDAFKRAAVKWGVGRFLYDLPIKVALTNGKQVIDDAGKVYYNATELVDKFPPTTKYLFNKK